MLLKFFLFAPWKLQLQGGENARLSSPVCRLLHGQHTHGQHTKIKLIEILLFRNAIKPFLVEVSLNTRADPTARCIITPAAAPCAIAVRSQSQAGASLPCIANFTLSTLCVPSA